MRNPKQFKLNTLEHFRCKYCWHVASFRLRTSDGGAVTTPGSTNPGLSVAGRVSGRRKPFFRATIRWKAVQNSGKVRAPSLSTSLSSLKDIEQKLLVFQHKRQQRHVSVELSLYHHHICDSSGIGSFDLVKKFFATVPERKINANIKLSR